MEKLYSIILNTVEKNLGESVDWARKLLNSSKSAVFKYFLSTPLANHRKFATAGQIAAAKIKTVLHESCGSCVQIEINLAKQNEVTSNLIENLVENKYGQLPEDISLIARYTDSVLKRDSDEVELRGKIKQELGEDLLSEIALAIATAQFHPTVKRTMGYGTVCNVGDLKY
jgi:hypothetical protein